MADPKISLIIPVKNEAENLPELIEHIKAAKLPKYEVIFIDDGSTDNSWQILNELAPQLDNATLIQFYRNCGQTAAFQAGIDAAKGEILVFSDADNQNNPEDIPKLLEKLDEGYDVVSGWRVDRQDSLTRTFPSRCANWLISKTCGVSLHDYGCSLKAYRAETLKPVKLYGEMHRFMPVYASMYGARITEIPVSHKKRIYGKSKYSLNRIFKVALDILVVKFLTSYIARPIYIFGGFGLFSFLISFLSLAFALYLKFFRDTSLIQTPLPLLAAISFLVGFLAILLGLISEVISRIYLSPHHYSIAKFVRFMKKD